MTNQNSACVMSSQAEDAIIIELSDGSMVHLVGPSAAGSLSTTTGWTTWDSAHVLISYMCQNERLDGANVADISTGNGLVALACAALGAENVVATEMGTCVALTQRNVELNKSRKDAPWAHRVKVLEYSWGEKLQQSPACGCSFAIVCDALFIAIRDGIEDELATTLHQICDESVRILFIYEERVIEKEMAFLERLRCLVNVDEVPDDHLDRDAARKAHLSEEESLSLDLFYERPSVRLFVLQKSVTI